MAIKKQVLVKFNKTSADKPPPGAIAIGFIVSLETIAAAKLTKPTIIAMYFKPFISYLPRFSTNPTSEAGLNIL
jgi:hypothetical protein